MPKGQNSCPIESLHVNDSPKILFLSLLAMITQFSKSKVVLVSYYVRVLDVLENFLMTWGISVHRLDGGVKLAVRQPIIDDWSNDPKAHFLLMSSKAGGVGLNLQAANHLILFDCSWNPAEDDQVLGRIYRTGQESECFFWCLYIAGTVDEIMARRQWGKRFGTSVFLGEQIPCSSPLDSTFNLFESIQSDDNQWKEWCEAHPEWEFGLKKFPFFKHCNQNQRKLIQDIVAYLCRLPNLILMHAACLENM